MSQDSDVIEGVETQQLIFGRWPLWATLVGAVSITSGLAFGYDQGVIGGAISFMQDEFGFGSFVEGMITSWVTIGALVGALFGGGLADRWSRKKALIFAAYLLVFGSIVQAIAPSVVVLIAGRFIIGAGVGIASVAAPMFVAESAPAKLRGRYVSGYQLAITIGIFVAQFVDYGLSEDGTWRLMVGLGAATGVLLLLAAYPVPHSARWLISVGRRDDAAESIRKVRGAAEVEGQLAAIEADLQDQPSAEWSDLLIGGARKALIVAVGLAIIQQITGINAVIYYSNEILAEAGFETASAQAGASLIAVGLVNVLATFIALAFVDRLGRRPLLIAGMTGMLAGLAGLTITFLYETTPGDTHSIPGSLALISMVVFIASFAFSLGPVVWTIISEVFPNQVRAKGMSVATAVNWGAAFVLTLLFPILLDGIGHSATFGLLAFFTVISMLWVARMVPETKGKTLEEVSAMFSDESTT
ncbi:sugar porter family MFS transporter [Ilumatobacter nonamiensis]|uniref:sugar porter family MFS transporter n=1 Tax=Ilumatobacter nonamiensis TaxID=467093 RepID=UPI000345BD47|nr:sugar porter family MFS transporter [Ilumatobacter nonamiensis]